MNLPILLYDIENKQLPINIIVTNQSIFIRSYQYFGIKIVEGQADIYSAKLLPQTNKPQVNKSHIFSFEENFAYTIHLRTSLVLELWNEQGDKVIYRLNYAPDIERLNQNYVDKLNNGRLPNFEELEPAILKDRDKREIVKRLLMDYKSIMRLKGTRKGIEKWLNYVGLSEFRVIEEYLTPDNKPTTTPNKSQDRKSGNYYLLVDISVSEGLTLKNMPKYVNQFENLDKFFERLFYALSLANLYFTLPEQDFTFFGLNYKSNMMKFLSITNRSYITRITNPHWYFKNIDITLSKTFELHEEYIIKNNINQKYSSIHSVVNFIKTGLPLNINLFNIDREIRDVKTVDDVNFKNLHTRLGSIFNLEIKAPNLYYEYTIISPTNKQIILSKNYLEDSISDSFNVSFFCDEIGEFKLTVNIYDHFNNREVFEFKWNVEDIYSNFDIFTSSRINENGDILKQIESPSVTSSVTSNPIIKLNRISNDLVTYFDNYSNSDVARYLTDNSRYILPELNSNFIVEKSTNLPVKYVDNWLEIHSFKLPETYSNNLQIYSNSYNPTTGVYEMVNIKLLPEYEPDKLFVTVLDIIDNDDETKTSEYIFISTKESSVNVLDIYDLYLSDDEINFIKLDNQHEDYSSTVIPVNYDFNLFHIKEHQLNYPDIDIVIESIFPRLINNQFDVVKLGDIILCKLSDNFKNNDLRWLVYDNYDDKLIFQTTDQELKYRIEDNIVYKIVVTFIFNGLQYSKTKIVSAVYNNNYDMF